MCQIKYSLKNNELSVDYSMGPKGAEVVFPYSGRYFFLLLMLLFPDYAKAEDVGHLVSAMKAELLPMEDQYRKKSGWEQMQVNYGYWLPASVPNLPACQQPVQVTSSEYDQVLWGAHAFRLDCQDQNGWSLRGKMNVSVTLPVWVMAKDVPGKQALTDTDLQLQTVKLETLNHGFCAQNESLVGYRSNRMLRAGQVADKNMLLPPLMIHKGEQIMIRAMQDGFKASMSGEALQDGIAGQTIKVRNISSQKELQAEVIGKAEVRVNF